MHWLECSLEKCDRFPFCFFFGHISNFKINIQATMLLRTKGGFWSQIMWTQFWTAIKVSGLLILSVFKLQILNTLFNPGGLFIRASAVKTSEENAVFWCVTRELCLLLPERMVFTRCWGIHEWVLVLRVHKKDKFHWNEPPEAPASRSSSVNLTPNRVQCTCKLRAPLLGYIFSHWSRCLEERRKV